MKNNELFLNRLKCSQCGDWMSPVSVTVWNEGSIFKTFNCSKCHHEKDTANYLRFIIGDSILEMAKKEKIQIVYENSTCGGGLS